MDTGGNKSDLWVTIDSPFAEMGLKTTKELILRKRTVKSLAI